MNVFAGDVIYYYFKYVSIINEARC